MPKNKNNMSGWKKRKNPKRSPFAVRIFNLDFAIHYHRRQKSYFKMGMDRKNKKTQFPSLREFYLLKVIQKLGCSVSRQDVKVFTGLKTDHLKGRVLRLQKTGLMNKTGSYNHFEISEKGLFIIHEVESIYKKHQEMKYKNAS